MKYIDDGSATSLNRIRDETQIRGEEAASVNFYISSLLVESNAGFRRGPAASEQGARGEEGHSAGRHGGSRELDLDQVGALGAGRVGSDATVGAELVAGVDSVTDVGGLAVGLAIGLSREVEFDKEIGVHLEGFGLGGVDRGSPAVGGEIV